MPYLIAFIALLCLTALHLRWRRRFHRLADAHQRDIADCEARQQALFNSMAEGVLILDSSERIQVANPSLQRLFNLNADVRGQTILEAFRIEPLSELVKRLRAGCKSTPPPSWTASASAMDRSWSSMT